jgi:hypothetical protein
MCHKDLEGGVRPVAAPHSPDLPHVALKLSPEGEGFNPPKVGQ